jgi:chemotaxis protein histidine kinase CheA
VTAEAPWYAEACAEFDSTLPQKAAVLEAQFEALSADPADRAARGRLREVLHRIHGSAGSYDRGDVSDIAAAGGRILDGVASDAGLTTHSLDRMAAIVALFRHAAANVRTK